MAIGIILVYAFLYLPLVVIGVFSFNASDVQSLPLRGFTTAWYGELARDPVMKDSVLFSLSVSVGAVLVSIVAGVGFALIFARVRFFGSRVLMGLLVVPTILPGMVLGISMLLAGRNVGIQPGAAVVTVAHITFLTPVVMFVVMQRLRMLDPSLEQASMDLGAGRVRTFVHVTFPSIRVAVLAAALLSFTISFDEVAVTFFVTGFRQTLPVHIWTLLRFGFTPEVNAVLTIIALVSVVSVVTASRLLSRSGSSII